MTYDIKSLRLAQSMSQKRLAHEAGIDVRTLRRIEAGVTVSPESYRAVCLALKIDPVIFQQSPETSTSVRSALTKYLELMTAASLEYGRTLRGKAIIATASIAVVAAASTAVHTWSSRPNVSVTIAFDRSCDERGIWSSAFSAMDREFPDGYTIKDRIEGAKDCTYRFEGHYDAAGPLDPKMTTLVRNLEHVGMKTTVTYISKPQDVTPRPKDYWEKDRIVSSSTVQDFSKSSYERVYRLSHKDLDGDISYARGLFADQASFESYVDALKSSGNLDAIAKYGAAVSVVTAAPSLSEKDPDGIWTVKFRSKISYSGKISVDQCLDATVRVKETDSELGILNIVSEPSVCRKT